MAQSAAVAVVAVVALGLRLAAAVELENTPTKPNILFVMADDLNADWKNDRLSYMPTVCARRMFTCPLVCAALQCVRAGVQVYCACRAVAMPVH